MDEQTVRKLEAAFCNDFTLEEAWDYANVKRSTYYDYMKGNPVFSDRMRKAQSYALTLAKRAIVSSIKEGGTTDARWLLEKRQPERYRTKVENEIPQLPNMTLILPGQKSHPRFVPEKKK